MILSNFENTFVFLFEAFDDYQFDIKKVFYVFPKKENEFVKKLQLLATEKETPDTGNMSSLVAGQLQAANARYDVTGKRFVSMSPKKTMYSKGELAGSIGDIQLWAKMLLAYHEANGPELNLVRILRNNGVRPSDIAVHNFYKDVIENLGDYVDYTEPGQETKPKSSGILGTLFKSVFSGSGKSKKRSGFSGLNLGPSITAKTSKRRYRK